MPIIGVKATSRQEDFYSQIEGKIAAKMIDDAVDMIMGLEDQGSQREVLIRLVNARYHELDDDVKRGHGTRSISDFARDLVLVRNLLRELVRLMNHYRDSDHARSLLIPLTLTFTLELALAHTTNLAKTRRLSHNLEKTATTIRTISRSLELLLYEVGFTKDETPRHQISLRGLDTFNPHALVHTVSPYLQALFDLQHIIAELRHDVYEAPRILSISQNSPFSVELTKVPDAINALFSIITPGGRKVAKQLEELKVKNAQADIALKEAQIAEAQSRSSQALEEAQAEIELKKAQAEKLRAESAKEYFEIDKAKIEMALAIIDKHAPNLPEAERLTYLTRLLQPLGVIIESPLKPDSLPEEASIPSGMSDDYMTRPNIVPDL